MQLIMDYNAKNWMVLSQKATASKKQKSKQLKK